MEIDDRVQQVFRSVFDDDSIRLEAKTTAEDIPEWDSIAHINLIVGIEQTFGVHFGTAELGSFRSVGDLVQALAQRGAL